MARLPGGTRRLVAEARVGHFATSSRGQPALVPVCFVLLGETVYVSWLGQVTVMALATLIAAVALLRAYRAAGDERSAPEGTRAARYDGLRAAPEPQRHG